MTWDSAITTDACNPVLKYKGDKGCPKLEYSILAKFWDKYSFIFGGIFIVIGLLLAFVGNYVVTFTLGCVTFLAVTLGGTFALSLFVDAVIPPEQVKDYAVWIILGVCALIGVPCAVFVSYKRKWAIFLLGVFGGCMGGLLLTTLFGAALQTWLYYVIIVASGLVAGIIAFKLRIFTIIFSTSFIGSYSCIRGISMYAGGFPDETQLFQLAQQGLITWNTFPKAFYGYLAGILVMFICAVIFQYKLVKSKVEEKLEEDNDPKMYL